LEEVVGSALERLEKSLAGRKVDVRIPEDLPPVPLDGTLMEQVFINLLENVVRHTPGGTAVDITAEQEGNTMKMTIADRGPGLKSDELDRVFEKFYHDPKSPGAGLGLAICQAILKAHGGTISASNRSEGGAIFLLRLPLGAAQETKP
jgi:two-component system, OmpR family, sensor histidine kinase KdpD